MKETPVPTIRCAIYARVSTTNGQSTDMQTNELKPYAKLCGWRVVNEAKYIDRGFSGAKKNRPGLDRLMADAAKHRFDVVLVWRFDRFARSAIHLAEALERFKALGIDFVSKTEQIDTRTPAGKMVFTVMGAVAEMERDLIRERVKAGLANARAKGTKLGRPPLQGRKRLATRVRKLWKQGEGKPFREIAKQLGISHMTACNLTK
jgi:DNA invertase Pin-like site-specific DNA recombinase